mgnify:CR=1 FL=1
MSLQESLLNFASNDTSHLDDTQPRQNTKKGRSQSGRPKKKAATSVARTQSAPSPTRKRKPNSLESPHGKRATIQQQQSHTPSVKKSGSLTRADVSARKRAEIKRLLQVRTDLLKQKSLESSSRRQSSSTPKTPTLSSELFSTPQDDSVSSRYIEDSPQPQTQLRQRAVRVPRAREVAVQQDTSEDMIDEGATIFNESEFSDVSGSDTDDDSQLIENVLQQLEPTWSVKKKQEESVVVEPSVTTVQPITQAPPPVTKVHVDHDESEGCGKIVRMVMMILAFLSLIYILNSHSSQQPQLAIGN